MYRFLIACAAFPLLANAAIAADCSLFSQRIEAELKDIAYIKAEGGGDDSAPRETNRLLNIMLDMQVISVNISLMQQNKCAAPSEPIAIDLRYYLSANNCVIAEMKRTNIQDQPPECDRTKWVPQSFK